MGINIASTINTIEVEFNEYGLSLEVDAAVFQKCDFRLFRKTDYIIVSINKEKSWNIAVIPTENCILINKINDQPVQDLSDLWNKLKTML